MNGRGSPSPADIALTSSAVVDEAVAAADGTRAAARWIASSLGAIPSLAILASIARVPGDAGFDPAKLAAGVALAALGAAIGLLSFAWVIAPVPLEDADIRQLDLARIPGQPYRDFNELDSNLDELRSSAATKEEELVGARAAAKRAEALAQQYEFAASEAEAAAAASHDNVESRAAATTARIRAHRERAAAAVEAGSAAACEEYLAFGTLQVSRRDAIRQQAYRLKAADVVGQRYRMARIGAVLSVILIATGIILLGLAPSNPRPNAASALPCSATLTLSKARQCVLDCRTHSAQPLETRGSASVAIVITLAPRQCQSRTAGGG